MQRVQHPPGAASHIFTVGRRKMLQRNSHMAHSALVYDPRTRVMTATFGNLDAKPDVDRIRCRVLPFSGFLAEPPTDPRR